MPRRTNDFQTAIAMLKSQLADGAVVTESHMLPDSATGRLREVDITLSSTVAGHSVLVGVECRDHKRVQSIGWVEEMHTKHQFLPTDPLVLVSSSGFTEGAERRAKLLGIELVTPERLTERQAQEIMRGAQAVQLALFKLELVAVNAKLAESEYREQEVVRVNSDSIVFYEDGCVAGSLQKIVAVIMDDAVNELMRRTESIEESPRFLVATQGNLRGVRTGVDHFVPLFLSSLEPVEHLARLLSVELVMTHGGAQSDIPLNHLQFKETPYSYGAGDLQGHPVVFVMSPDGEGGEAVSIRFADEHPKAHRRESD